MAFAMQPSTPLLLCISLIFGVLAPLHGASGTEGTVHAAKGIKHEVAPNAQIAQGDAAAAAKDYRKALDIDPQATRDPASAIRASALTRGAELYSWGLCVERDDRRAAQLYQQSAVLGNRYGQTYYASALFFGTGVGRDLPKALYWAEKAAAAGVPKAMNQAGWQYLQGMGVAPDSQKARQYYLQSAARDDATGQEQLGWMYAHVPPVDYHLAMEWYRRAAKQDDETAQNNIAYLYENGLGVTKDYREAYGWYSLSAGQGYSRAKYHLGDFYDRGIVVTKDAAANYPCWLWLDGSARANLQKTGPASSNRPARCFYPRLGGRACLDSRARHQAPSREGGTGCQSVCGALIEEWVSDQCGSQPSEYL